MARNWPEELRWQLGAPLLERLGVQVSPEFGAALKPAPKEKEITGGWQAGKSVELSCEVILDAPLWRTFNRPFRYWNILPSYETPHKEFDYVAQHAARLGILSGVHTPQNGSCFLSMHGGRVVLETKTAKNLEAIAGEPCDGVLVTEAGQIASGVQEAAHGRTMARNGWIVYGGTLEDDEMMPRWAWFQENAAKWMLNGPGRDMRAFALPSWANRSQYPMGEHDPKIEALRLRFDEYTFNRRIAAVASGVQNQVYPQVTRKQYLVPMPQGLRWEDGAGGIDFGTAHPSALTVETQASNGDVWVRECVFLPGREMGSEDAADRSLIEWHMYRLSQKYELTGQGAAAMDGGKPIWRWGGDPNVRHSGLEDLVPVSGAAGSRDARIGFGTTRLNNNTMFFDQNGPGVTELYAEIGRVHKIKTQQGELVLWRRDDDRTASWEDANEMLDGSSEMPTELGSVEYVEGGKKDEWKDPYKLPDRPSGAPVQQGNAATNATSKQRALPGRR